MGLVYPPGTEVQFILPPYSHLPKLSQAERDVADLITAAMDTPHFPEAKQSHITLINKRLDIVFPRTPSTTKGPNRRARRSVQRAQLKKGRK